MHIVNIDNNCDGNTDWDEPGCVSCVEAGGEGCYNSLGQPDWGNCLDEKTAGNSFCQLTEGAWYKCYGCVTGCTYRFSKCCITDNSPCNTDNGFENSDCCGYDSGSPLDGFLCHLGTCADTAECGPPACDADYWSVDCLLGGNLACCEYEFGDPPITSGREQTITVY